MGDGHIRENENLGNKYDNTDFVQDRSIRDVVAGYSRYDEIRAYKLYLETLKLEAEMAGAVETIDIPYEKADGTTDVHKVKINQLIQKPTKFENYRRLVIAKLNSIKDERELKQLMSDFEEDSIYELSGKIANHMIDKTRRERVAISFDFAKAPP